MEPMALQNVLHIGAWMYHAMDYGPASGGPQTTLTWITKFQLYAQLPHAHVARF